MDGDRPRDCDRPMDGDCPLMVTVHTWDDLIFVSKVNIPKLGLIPCLEMLKSRTVEKAVIG